MGVGLDGGKIAAVFFDIGNVLLGFDPKEVLRVVARETGHSPLSVAAWLYERGIADRVERGTLSPEELFALFREELGYSGNWRGFRLLWCDHFTLNRRNDALLKKISRRYPVYLLSNTNELHYEFIAERYSFVRSVRGAFLSHRLGLRKPESGIYQAALSGAGLRAEQAAFIDDLKANVDAARAAGMRGVHYRPGIDLRTELLALGLEWER